jgi:hypothetical protein
MTEPMARRPTPRPGPHTPHDPRPRWIPHATPTGTDWDLAGNLAHRADALDDAYPGIVIYAIGDDSHQSGQSDHNRDSRSIVHAIDAMTYDDTAAGDDIVAWLRADPKDLEYVIFDGVIYERWDGFQGSRYYGSNPHTDHVHASGKHGDTGYTSGTGTGYDTAAEAYRPAGMGDTMTTYSEEDMRAFPWQYDGRGMPGVPEGQSTLWVLGEIYSQLGALKTQLTTLQDSVDELELAAGTSPDGAHHHGPAQHGAAPPA